MNEPSTPPANSPNTGRDSKLKQMNEYDIQTDSADTRSKRVGVYDRPEPSSMSSSMMGTILLLLAIVAAIYFLFFANNLPS